MINIMNGWGDLSRLEKILQKASGNSGPLMTQVRSGDSLPQALKKIFSRPEPAQGNGEQTIVLARLHDQMLKYEEEPINPDQEPFPNPPLEASN